MSKNNLFKWKRQTTTPDTSKRKQKDGMSEWIKKIQDASEDAAKEAFGEEIFDNSYDKSLLMPDDEAIYEAQELVSGWLQEKSFSNLQHELEFQDEKWNKLTTEYARKPSNKFDVYDDTKPSNLYYESLLNVGDNYYNDYDMEDPDEGILVSEVLSEMMNKDFTKTVDLGMTPLQKQIKDPTPKMDVRHRQVKEKSQARKEKELTKRKTLQMEKDVKRKARERVEEEEKERSLQHEQEEKAIQYEMLRIRQDLEEEKKFREAELKRKEEIFQQAKLQMQMELRKQKVEEEGRRRQNEKDKKKREIVKEERFQRETLMEMKSNMQYLHKHFAAWYNLILERRIGMGKARAIADWKCKIRAWNAWKAYIVCVRTNQEARAIEWKMKENYRKEQMAINHCNKKLLRLCLYSWRKYARHKMEKKLLRIEHELKTKKMAMFIENVSRKIETIQKPGNKYIGGDFQPKATQQKDQEKQGPVDLLQNFHHKAKLKDKIHIKQQPQEQNSIIQLDVHRNSEDELLKKHGISRQDSNNIRLGISLHGNMRKKKHVIKNVVEDLPDNVIHGDERKNLIDQQSRDQNESNEPIENEGFINEEIPLTNQRNPIKPKITPRIRSDKPVTKPLHLAMEERDQQRRERRALIEAEKRRKEEEKLKDLRKKQEERLRMEEEEKEERIKKRKEEKRIQAEKEREKQEQQALCRAKLDLSKQHYQKHLLRKYGLQPLKHIVEISRLNVQLSDRYYSGILLRTVFNEWHLETKNCMEEKQEKADLKYKEILLKRSFNSWKKCRFHVQKMNKLARSFSIRRIVEKTFRAWQDFVTDERILMWAKENDAEEHDLVRMKKKYFKEWIQFVETEKGERIREKRRNELRKKVQTWLPDFKQSSKT